MLVLHLSCRGASCSQVLAEGRHAAAEAHKWPIKARVLDCTSSFGAPSWVWPVRGRVVHLLTAIQIGGALLQWSDLRLTLIGMSLLLYLC